MGIGSDAKGFGYITCPGAVRKDDRELVGIVHRRGPVRTVPEYMETKLSNIVEPMFDDVRTNWLARVSEAAHALAATHVQEQLGADTSRSSLSIGATIPINRVPLVSDRDRWLDPPPARSWQLRSKSTLAVIGALIGLTSAIAITDVIPIEQFPLLDFWRQLAIDGSELVSWSPAASPIQTEPRTARLIVQPSREMSGKPVRLVLALQGRSEGAVVTITGLVPGMELSNGDSVGAAAWSLAAADLHDIWIGPPDGFVGSIDLVAELRLPEDRVVDRQIVHLEWLPSISPPFAQSQRDREDIMPEQRKSASPSFAQSMEVSDLVRTFGITRDQARRLINRIGNDRVKLEQAARILKARFSARSSSEAQR
jgi:hypothetical protein